MTALDDAIRLLAERFSDEDGCGLDHQKQPNCGCLLEAGSVVNQLVTTGLLILADDREGLLEATLKVAPKQEVLAALGAEQIGWEHTTDELCIGSFVNDDCPDCVPVYKVQP